jgi:outer membrane protein OmpA-like peptidoglycan-associated protein
LAGFHAWLDRFVLHLEGGQPEEIEKLEIWAGIYQAYEMLVRRNITGGAKVVHRVHFAPNRSALEGASAAVLNEVGRLLAENPRLMIEIGACCDDPRLWDESVRLAQARVGAVSAHLERAGIDSKRILKMGGGSYHQLVPSDTEEGRAFNRRVELRPIY